MSAKPKRPQHVFVVDRTERLSPHMVRVHLGGPAFDDFVAAADPGNLAATDKYVKLLVAKPGLGLEPPFDLDALRETLPKQDRPSRRTYTVRSVDHDARTIAIDFVVHGDQGLAGPWAAAARPGDRLALSGPGGGYAPSADPAVTHVLLGDDSALPAISAALEAMPDSATGVALVEVAGPADEQQVAHPPGVDLRWLHRDATGAAPGTLLLEAARSLERASRPVQVFAHGERTAMKAIRRLLQDDWGLEKSEMSLSAYWALGRAEDRFQEEKREPVGVIFTD
ncbi:MULTISPECIES: siderophore-interacting protein [unclassified Curtobacterium]|uniref:siderophore-interacting protein n=1 Tax=unclassified Curtobacterium TaxID=257496 RepID=UPI0008DCCA0D|nr:MULTISPECIES: siderophore-interacting protein [unclassified Curtobacterium]OIH95039.1 NADPH-dependent ferric siderophore reductase [Curtobacterium sp. MCBA15_003]OII12855.1 NADPH-dependent ferric siderophore reductase [Curtobacterium sp. MCBA15_009]OII32200.1 NADPH-dependent ferric siderophore reductase [Curtobacterium sp. MMLR14_006]